MTYKKKEGWESNRDIVKKPKRGLFYCWNCDHYLMYEAERCKYCSHKHKQVIRRYKK